MSTKREVSPSKTGARAAPADYRARVSYYRRLFGRGVGRTPTSELKLALDRAAYAAAEAWQVRNYTSSFTETGRIAILREERLCMKALQVAIDRDREDRGPARPLHQLMLGVR